MALRLRPRALAIAIALTILGSAPLRAQTPMPPQASAASGWKTSTNAERYGDKSQSAAANAPTPSYGAGAATRSTNDITPIGPTSTPPSAPGATRAVVTKGNATLPNDKGQVWREYDIRPYTQRAGNTAKPEQAIVDWILRETGYEAWHADTDSLLSANHDMLRVYHTPQIHAVVADIADRFVNSSATAYAFTLRVATVRNPNWRAKALTMMTPIPVQSPGVQGWLLAKEDARLLLSELSRRTDFRDYNSSQQLVNNGQSILISTMHPRSYVRGAIATQTAWPGFQPEMGTLEEGFALEFSPLLSLDLASADAVVKLRLNQVEKMLPVKLDLPSTVAPNQRVQVDVPQLTSANLHERFHWPTDRVLLLSMGVVATPGPSKDNPLTDAVTDAVPLLKSPPRADALLFVESAGIVQPAPEPATARAASLPTQSYQGRY